MRMAVLTHLSVLGFVFQVINSQENETEDPISALSNAIPGVPGEDYPIYGQPPETSFSCDNQVNGGYYGDPEAECQSFHICVGDVEGQMAQFSFLCPNGTLFQQQYFVCDWWFNVDCSKVIDFYALNTELYAAREVASEGDRKGRSDNLERSEGTAEQDNDIEAYLSSTTRQDQPRNKLNIKAKSNSIKRGRGGSGLKKGSETLVTNQKNVLADINSISIEFPSGSLPSVEKPSGEISVPTLASIAGVQTLYGAPAESFSPGSEKVLRFEAEIPPSLSSRDLEFGYRNVAKEAKLAPSPQELLYRLVRMVNSNAE